MDSSGTRQGTLADTSEPYISGWLKVVSWRQDRYSYFSFLLPFIWLSSANWLSWESEWWGRYPPSFLHALWHRVLGLSWCFHSFIIWVLFLAWPGILEERETVPWVLFERTTQASRDVGMVKFGLAFWYSKFRFWSCLGHFPACLAPVSGDWCRLTSRKLG
jgi:hypothetical protein